MTTKEIAEMVFGKIVESRTKEYSSINRSLRSLEKQGIAQRVYVQLRWRLKPQIDQTRETIGNSVLVKEKAK